MLADILPTEDTLMVFTSSMDPNETPCNTASHCDTYCLQFQHNGYIEHFQISAKSGDIRRNGRPVHLSALFPWYYMNGQQIRIT